MFSFGNSFYTGDIPSENPLKKRDQIDPVAALRGVSDSLDLSIATTKASAKAETTAEHYIIEGSTGAYQDPKARLVYFQTPEGTLSLTWRVETDLLDDWILSYVDAKSGEEVFGVVNYVADATYKV